MLVLNFFLVLKLKHDYSCCTKKLAPTVFLGINKQYNRHTTPPQTHIAFIVPRTKGIGSRHKSVTGNNQGKQQTTPCDNQ